MKTGSVSKEKKLHCMFVTRQRSVKRRTHYDLPRMRIVRMCHLTDELQGESWQISFSVNKGKNQSSTKFVGGADDQILKWTFRTINYVQLTSLDNY